MTKSLPLLLLLFFPSAALANDFEYKIYFGLAQKTGSVSLEEWDAYEKNFAESFAGFNAASTLGYYQGSRERAKLITLIMDECHEPKLHEQIRQYVKRFQQDSVLVTKTALSKWQLVESVKTVTMDDSCA